MPGELTAIFAAVCYALSFVLLHLGQSEDELPDNGLFPILVISSLTFLCALFAGNMIRGGLLVSSLIHSSSTKYAFLGGVVGTLFGRLALYTSIERLGATRGVVIKTLSPFVTLTLAILFLREVYKPEYTLGLVLLVAGITVVIIEHLKVPVRGYPISYFMTSIGLAFLAANLQGVGHLFRKLSTSTSVSPIWLSAVDLCTATLGYILVLLITGRFFEVIRVYMKHLHFNVITAGVLSAAGVLLFFHSVSQIDVSKVSVIIGAEPVFVALISALISPNLERLTGWTMASTVLVACGVIIISL